MRLNTMLIISAIIVIAIFVLGCQAYDTFSESLVATQQKMLTSNEMTGNTKPLTKQADVYAAEHWMDIETVEMKKDEILELEIASYKDAYFTLGDEDYFVRNESPATIRFRPDEAGEYKLECNYKCKPADLAKEMRIVVS